MKIEEKFPSLKGKEIKTETLGPHLLIKWKENVTIDGEPAVLNGFLQTDNIIQTKREQLIQALTNARIKFEEHENGITLTDFDAKIIME